MQRDAPSSSSASRLRRGLCPTHELVGRRIRDNATRLIIQIHALLGQGRDAAAITET